MTRHLRVLTLLISCLFGTAFVANTVKAEPRVVASIPPIHSLVAAVMEGVAKPTLLLKANASPHTYSLKPSQAREISRADAIFWVAHDIESFMEKPINSLSQKGVSIEFGELPGITLLKYREGGAWEEDDHETHAKHDDHKDHGHDKEHGEKHAKHDDHKDHGHDKEHGEKHAKHDDHKDHGHDKEHGEKHAKHDDHKDHGHDKEHGEKHGKHDDHKGHEGHAHGEYDMHIWLDPKNARVIVAAVADKLKSIDPANAATYDANTKKVSARLKVLENKLGERLATIKKSPFFVFHDAYQYFEKRFGLNGAGSITVSPERKPGAKRVAELRKKLENAKVDCVFSEPQFEPAIVKTLVAGTNAKSGVLDPLGAGLQPGPNGYFKLMEKMANSFLRCLSPSSQVKRH